MKQKFDKMDFRALEEYIKGTGSPVLFEYQGRYFAIVITEPAKKKYLNMGYITFTLAELEEWIKDEESFDLQQKKAVETAEGLIEGYEVAKYVKDFFKGEILDLRRRNEGTDKL